MDDKVRAEQIDAARREIARRIARFCTTLSEEEFNHLLDRMAYVHWKYDVAPDVDAARVALLPPLRQASRTKGYTG
jgi:hypothetical protein